MENICTLSAFCDRALCRMAKVKNDFLSCKNISDRDNGRHYTPGIQCTHNNERNAFLIVLASQNGQEVCFSFLELDKGPAVARARLPRMSAWTKSSFVAAEPITHSPSAGQCASMLNITPTFGQIKSLAGKWQLDIVTSPTSAMRGCFMCQVAHNNGGVNALVLQSTIRVSR